MLGIIFASPWADCSAGGFSRPLWPADTPLWELKRNTRFSYNDEFEKSFKKLNSSLKNDWPTVTLFQTQMLLFFHATQNLHAALFHKTIVCCDHVCQKLHKTPKHLMTGQTVSVTPAKRAEWRRFRNSLFVFHRKINSLKVWSDK